MQTLQQTIPAPHPEAEPVIVMRCPCERWSLRMPVAAGPEEVKRVLAEHLAECVVLQAAKITALAASS